MIQVGTIRQVLQELRKNGFQVSEYALRQWVRSGRIPAVYSGSTAYIAYDAVVAFLIHPQTNLSS